MSFSPARKKITREIHLSSQDAQGNTTSSISSQELYTDNEPAYVKLYVQDLLGLRGLPKTSHDVLLCVLQQMNWQNKVYLSGPLRKDIIATLGIKPITMAKALEGFVAENILYREAKGVYLVNPHLFGKGAWKDIKAIRLTVNYEPDQHQQSSRVMEAQIAYDPAE